MSRIKYDMSLMRDIALFEKLTGAPCKDCIAADPVTFVLEAQYMGKALGKGARNVEKLERAFKRKIKIVAFDPELEHFVRNVVYPIEVGEVRIEGEVVLILEKSERKKGLLIGKGGRNLRRFEAIVGRYFPDIKEIKVQ